MGWIILAIFFGITLPLLGLIIGQSIHESQGGEKITARWGMLGGIIVYVILMGLTTLTASIKTVDAGHVGLVYQFGGIVGQREEGPNLIAPWQGFKVVTIQVQKVRPETSCLDGTIPECLEAFSSETQDVFIRPTLNLSVDPKDVQDLYRNIGPDYLDKIVRPRLLQIFKDITVKYKSVDIAPNREAIRVAVRERLQIELSAYSIKVNDLLIDNLDFRPEFKTAIENKQIATQEALKQQELVAAEEAKARQVAATAQGAADKLRIEAQGQADANHLISESLTPELIQFQALQKLGVTYGYWTSCK
jgi:regulator of protease activity HflC (stomatin/prohibitin superfamily)